jgi:sulfate permease, SulP family
VPEGVAYATLAGLPPQVGIYGYLLGGLGYGLFGSSRHLAIGPTSAISLMVGAQKSLYAVLDITWVPIIDETARQIPQQTATVLQFL